MPVDYAPMSLVNHNRVEVAHLIEQSAPELLRLTFGYQILPILTALIARSHNRYSYQHLRVATIGNQVIGIAALVSATEVNDQRDFPAVLPIHKRLRLWLVDLIVRQVMRHDYPANTFYVANLAVDKNYRNQGIGTQLLQNCIAEAKAAGATELYISVDIANPRAQKLYESLGFKLIETKMISLLNHPVGSRILRLILSDDRVIDS